MIRSASENYSRTRVFQKELALEPYKVFGYPLHSDLS